MSAARTFTSTVGGRRLAIVIVASVVCLTLLFTVQDAMRRGVGGGDIDWARALSINALDWVTWGILLPFIIAIGQRIRLDGSGTRALRVAAWVGLALAFCLVQSTITGLVIRLTRAPFFGLVGAGARGAPPSAVGVFLLNWGFATASLNLLIFGMTAGAFHAVLYYRDLRVRQLREADLEARLARAELNVLRMQLQPHFLFNALHTVSSLMVSDVATAQRVVSSLGDLLRSSLDHTAQQEIALRDELAFVQRYLDIQRARFRQRLTVDVDVPDDVEGAMVPSLVLQPLVENAIRHGVEPRTEGGRVWIRARRDGDALILTVENDRLPNDEASGAGRGEKRGVGLANVAARLRQLYGTSHAFQATASGGDRFRITMALPYHTLPVLR